MVLTRRSGYCGLSNVMGGTCHARKHSRPQQKAATRCTSCFCYVCRHADDMRATTMQGEFDAALGLRGGSTVSGAGGFQAFVLLKQKLRAMVESSSRRHPTASAHLLIYKRHTHAGSERVSTCGTGMKKNQAPHLCRQRPTTNQQLHSCTRRAHSKVVCMLKQPQEKLADAAHAAHNQQVTYVGGPQVPRPPCLPQPHRHRKAHDHLLQVCLMTAWWCWCWYELHLQLRQVRRLQS